MHLYFVYIEKNIYLKKNIKFFLFFVIYKTISYFNDICKYVVIDTVIQKHVKIIICLSVFLYARACVCLILN